MPGRMVKMAFHSSSSSATDPFHLSQTSTIMGRFGASGFPTCIYDLKVMSIDRNVSAIKQTLQSQIRQYPATCGIKVNTSYNSSMGEITVDAALKSSLGGEYDLVYVLVTDGLTASGGNETSYDYTVRAISNNYLSMSTDGRFTVKANEEHTAATFSISNAKNLNPAGCHFPSFRSLSNANIIHNTPPIAFLLYTEMRLIARDICNYLWLLMKNGGKDFSLPPLCLYCVNQF